MRESRRPPLFKREALESTRPKGFFVLFIGIGIGSSSRVRDSHSRVRDSLSRVRVSPCGEKVVGLFQKWYDFLKSGTTFLWEQLSRVCISCIQNRISCSAQRRQLKMFARRCTARVGVFKKTLSLSQPPIYRAFQALFLLLTFHKRFTPYL